MRQTPNILQATAATALYTWTALCMAGCTPDETAEPADIAVPLQISSVNVLSPQAEAVTRAGYDDTFFDDTNPIIEVFRLANSNYTQAVCDTYVLEEDYSSGNSYWQKQEKYGRITLTQHPADICALFPDMGQSVDIKAIPLNSEEFHNKSQDICYAPRQTVSARHNTVSLEMKHALSRLEFAFRMSTPTAEGVLNEISIQDIPRQCTFDISTETYTTPTNKEIMEKTFASPGTPFTGDFVVLYDILVVPFSVDADGLRIILKANGDYFNLFISEYMLPSLQAGYKCRVNITVHPFYADVTSVSIVQWELFREEKYNILPESIVNP